MTWLFAFACITSPGGYQALVDEILDSDGDGFVDATWPEEGGDDCDDDDATIHPGAVEACDGIDQDCDGAVDEGNDDFTGWFHDADGDGYGDPLAPIETCPVPEGAVQNGDDCDDVDDGIHPAGDELCDGVDGDCDGVVDEGLAETWYLDADADGHGNPDAPVTVCTGAPDGYVGTDDDCDDGDGDSYPGAEEICGDGVVNDCDAAGEPDCRYEGTVDLTDGWILGEEVAGWAGASIAASERDLVVGAPMADDVLIGDLAPLPTGLSQLTRLYGDGGGQAGTTVQFTVDINGDTQPDVIVGAPKEEGNDGAVYLLTTPFPTSDGALEDAAEGVLRGYRAERIGRFITSDATGTLYSAGGNGIVHRIDLGEGLLGAVDADSELEWLSGLATAPSDAAAVLAADVDGDGVDEILVGDHLREGDGCVFEFSGAAPNGLLPEDADREVCLAHDGFGAVLSLLPDLDGDGVSDLFVGSPDDGGTQGSFYGSGLAGGRTATLSGAYGGLGKTTAATDLDLDGEVDLLVGATDAFLVFYAPEGSLDAADAEATLTLYGSAVGTSAAAASIEGTEGVLVGAPTHESARGGLLFLAPLGE